MGLAVSRAHWHIDGHDKLKPDGFIIHGCIDGYKCKIIWLGLDRTNNNMVVITRYHMDDMKKYRGCPLKVRTDLRLRSCEWSWSNMSTVIWP